MNSNATNGQSWMQKIRSFDDRRDLAIPGNKAETLTFCAEQFISVVNQAIAHKGLCCIALSGGSTPKALYELLSSPVYCKRVNWSKVHLFWSDERCVPADHQESNYHMAMEAGLNSLAIPKGHIHRMEADNADLDEAAKNYEALIDQWVPGAAFDLIMLGMGEDGHTASLFPKTHGLHAQNRNVIANYVPDKHTWRMTFTYDLINRAHKTDIYVIGESKAVVLNRVLTGSYLPDELPIQKIGTRTHKALWVADSDAAKEIQLLD